MHSIKLEYNGTLTLWEFHVKMLSLAALAGECGHTSTITERWLKTQPETSGAVHLCQCEHFDIAKNHKGYMCTLTSKQTDA